jgi:hypothetical protein
MLYTIEQAPTWKFARTERAQKLQQRDLRKAINEENGASRAMGEEPGES